MTGAVLLRAASLHLSRSAAGSSGMATVKKPYDDPENIALCEQLYRETGNPIHAWEGWSLSRKNGIPTPEWVAEYLDHCSTAIHGIASKTGLSPTVYKIFGKTPPASGKKVDIPAALAKGFGFSKGRGYNISFTEWSTTNERVLIARCVIERMAAGDSLSAAAAEVAHKLGISESSAKRAFRNLGDDGTMSVEKLRASAGEAESGA